MDCGDKLVHEKLCMRNFNKVRFHVNSPIRYSISEEKIKVYYYYNDDDLFDLDKDISTLKQFIKTSKLDKNGWKRQSLVAVRKETFNYSDIYFKRSFRFMTRLDIIRGD